MSEFISDDSLYLDQLFVDHGDMEHSSYGDDSLFNVTQLDSFTCSSSLSMSYLSGSTNTTSTSSSRDSSSFASQSELSPVDVDCGDLPEWFQPIASSSLPTIVVGDVDCNPNKSTLTVISSSLSTSSRVVLPSSPIAIEPSCYDVVGVVAGNRNQPMAVISSSSSTSLLAVQKSSSLLNLLDEVDNTSFKLTSDSLEELPGKCLFSKRCTLLTDKLDYGNKSAAREEII